MDKNNTGKNSLNLSNEEALKKKKKIISHCTNLECQKEQLLILIDKLYSISSARMSLMPEEQEHNVLSKYLMNTSSYLYSIGDQLCKAQLNRKKIEEKIFEAKKQLISLNKVLKDKKQV